MVAGLGLVLAWWHATVLVSSASAPPVALLGTGILLVVSFLLVGAGSWLAVGATGPDTPVRAAGWLVVLTTAFGTVGVLVSLHLEYVTGGFDGRPLVADLVTVGAAVGLLVGQYDARGRRYEAALYEERDRFVSLFDNLPNPAVRYRLADGAAVVLEANTAFEDTFGVEESAASERSIGTILSPDDDVSEVARNGRGADDDSDPSAERRLVSAEGLRDFRVIPVPYREEEGFCIWIDVTDRKLQVRRLAVLNRVLRHDLRTDASVISGHAELLPDTEATETIRERALALAERGTAARRAEEALADGTDRRPIDLPALLADELEAIRTETDARVQADLAVATVSGSAALRMAIAELLENAVEHNDADDPTLRVTVTAPSADADERFAAVEIADDGPGFPEMERAVFEEASETPLQHSSGLGLWLARWVIADIGGEVSIEDREPRGTVVRLRLPRAE
jgi:PAS domain S-box-containing protein